VLATASGPLGRPDLLGLAAGAGRRLERLGRCPDGTLTVPLTIPHRPTAAPVAYGWCHGAAGTTRLFTLLDQLQPGEGWAACAAAGRAAIQTSGLPARLWPGFWDNLGQCCGTAGVGEAVLDHYQDTGDRDWLDFADVLAADVLSRAIADAGGVRWSHTEHRVSPPQLEPVVGWMQGAAGIAGFLLRLDRLHRDGPAAPRLPWPDRPPAPGLNPIDVTSLRIEESDVTSIAFSGCRTRRGGATRRRSRCGRAGPGRAAGTCPRCRRRRGCTPSRCGRPCRPPARRR